MGMMRKYMFIFILVFLWDLPIILASNICTSHIQRVELLEGIPKNLLAAMARVESGRYNGAKKIVEPWPWTVQSQGKSNYFGTKAEAVNHVKALQKKGIKNIDVGCMQMNFLHHGHKFRSIEEMFEPAHNVAQGAKYLKQLKSHKNQAWSTAVGNYHSFTPVHHIRYKNLVLKNFGLVNGEQGTIFKDSLYAGGTKDNGSSSKGSFKAVVYTYSPVHGMKGNSDSHKQTHKIIRITPKN
jgi:hypothetical protein